MMRSTGDRSVYLQPEDDGLLMRGAGRWAEAKLDYLARYINVFETSMRGKWKVRHYVDLFAGPGKNRIRETGRIFLGSPLLAITTLYPFTRCFFVDSSLPNTSALQSRCQESPFRERVDIRTGDCNMIVNEIVNWIRVLDQQRQQSGLWTSFNLAFLDPEGLELDWTTVATLASVGRMDLIITYPQLGLNRNMRRAFTSDKSTAVDGFFGGQGWRHLYDQYLHRRVRGIHQALLDLYKGMLQDLGYIEVRRDDETGYEPLIRNAKCRAPMYRLIFASKHKLGGEFWHLITRRDVWGQKRLL